MSSPHQDQSYPVTGSYRVPILWYTVAMQATEETADHLVDQSTDWYTEIQPLHTTVELGPNQPEMLLRQASFLTAYAKYGNVYEACEVARVTQRTVAHWRSTDSLDFRNRLTDADDAYIDRMEGRMRALAEEGRSFQAIDAILKAKRGAVWRDKSTLDTGTADLLAALTKQAQAPARTPGQQWGTKPMPTLTAQQSID